MSMGEEKTKTYYEVTLAVDIHDLVELGILVRQLLANDPEQGNTFVFNELTVLHSLFDGYIDFILEKANYPAEIVSSSVKLRTADTAEQIEAILTKADAKASEGDEE